MIRILLVGICGQMGHAILEAASNQSGLFSVVAGVDRATSPTVTVPVYENISDVREEYDAIVDFSVPAALTATLHTAMALLKPVVVATTGLTETHMQLIREASGKVPVFQTGNMSLGVNLQMNLIREAKKALGSGYDVEIVETHHRRKMDAPSGTAQMLANCIREECKDEAEILYGRHGTSCRRQDQEITVHSVRGGTIVGEHQVMFLGRDEVIEITHRAYSKQVFAVGALRATAYIMEKPAGIYNMQDVVTEGDIASRVSMVRDQAVIHLYGLKSGTAFTSVFDTVTEAGVGVDMISYVPSFASRTVGFTVDRRQLSDASNALMGLIAREGLTIRTESDAVKLVIEGAGMALRTGVASRVFDVLSNSGIDILLVTTGETKIEVAVPAAQAPRAAAAIGEYFAD